MLSEEKLREIAEWPPLHEETLELIAELRRLRPVAKAAAQWVTESYHSMPRAAVWDKLVEEVTKLAALEGGKGAE